MEPEKAQARKVQRELERLGCESRVIELSGSARSVEEAARSAGCAPEQVVKVGKTLGEPVSRATADFVREKTGFAIGGVPPVAHREPPVTLADPGLLVHEEVWAAAGTHNAVFGSPPGELVRITGADVAPVGP